MRWRDVLGMKQLLLVLRRYNMAPKHHYGMIKNATVLLKLPKIMGHFK